MSYLTAIWHAPFSGVSVSAAADDDAGEREDSAERRERRHRLAEGQCSDDGGHDGDQIEPAGGRHRAEQAASPVPAAEVKAKAKECGADIVGIAPMSRWEGSDKQHDPRYIFPGAEAMSKKLEGRVIDIITRLRSWEVNPEIVTTASPFIARTLKGAFPEIEVRASVNMRLTTLQAFRYLAPLFDSYYLGRDVQRNLETVRAFSGWCHDNGKKLCILANSGCLRNCPWQTYHDNLIAHSDEACLANVLRGFD